MIRERSHFRRWLTAALVVLMLCAQGMVAAHTVDHLDSGAETCLTCKAGNSPEAAVDTPPEASFEADSSLTRATFQRGQNSRQCPGPYRTRAPPSDAPQIRI